MKKVSYENVREQLDFIKRGIADRAYANFRGYNDTDGWGGGDLLVTTESLQEQTTGFYPDPRKVVTPYAHEVGWLVTKLWKLFAESKLLDHCNKIEFFGRLGNAAIRYQNMLNGKQESADAILTAVFEEAAKMLDEMCRGEFVYLHIAQGGVISENLK